MQARIQDRTLGSSAAGHIRGALVQQQLVWMHSSEQGIWFAAQSAARCRPSLGLRLGIRIGFGAGIRIRIRIRRRTMHAWRQRSNHLPRGPRCFRFRAGPRLHTPPDSGSEAFTGSTMILSENYCDDVK